MIISNEADHNCQALENETNTNVFYVVENPPITSDMEPLNNVHNTQPTRILVCDPNFSNMTIMDVGAIQTIDQDAQPIIS